MIKRISMLAIATMFVVVSVQAQNPIWVEGTAGLALPTQGDFRDAYNTGMSLGGRAGYGVNAAIDGTATIKYNRYKFDSGESEFDATLSTLNVMAGGRYKFPSERKMGYEVGSEVGISRLSLDINNPGIIFEDPILGKTADTQIRFEGDSATKLAWSLLGYVTYNIVANTYLFLSPSFNMIFADENSHHLDVAVGARFLVGGSR